MEFNLSEKSLKWLKDPMLKGGMMGRTFIDERDVKEFIKLLKEKLRATVDGDAPRDREMEGTIDIINKLAGDKLI